MFEQNIETFITVAESGSFSKAAEKLYVSRSALLQQINLLEQKLGFSLFSRSNKGVVLTRAGNVYYHEMLQLLEKHKQILNTCLNIQDSESIKIGLLSNFPSTILPYMCILYREKYPHRQIQFVEYPLNDYFRAFMNNAFDITAEYVQGIYNNIPGYAVLNFMSTVHCIGVPHEHPFCEVDQITPDMLNGHSISMYRYGISQPDDALRNYFKKNVPNLTILDFDSYTSYLDTYCNTYNNLLVLYDAYETNFPGLIKKPLKISENIRIQLGIGYHKLHSLYVQDFLDIVSEIFLPQCT